MMKQGDDKMLQRQLDVWGATPERWPADRREALAARYEEAEARGMPALQAARALDAALDALPRPAPAGDALLARLRTIPERSGPRGALARLLDQFLALATPRLVAGEAAAFAAAIIAGLWLGGGSTLVQAETLDLSPWLLGAPIEMFDEGTTP